MISDYQQKEAVIDYHIRSMKKEIESMERHTDLSEKQKIGIGKRLEFIKAIEGLKVAFKKQQDIGLGKLPPQDIDLERAILGALMLEASASKVCSFLMPSHFYREEHQTIYETIHKLYSEGKPIDIRTVVTSLRFSGKIDKVGGPVYLAAIQASVSSAANVEYHSRCLVEFAIKRELILFAGQLLHEAHDDSTDCFELIKSGMQSLKKIEELNTKK